MTAQALFEHKCINGWKEKGHVPQCKYCFRIMWEELKETKNVQPKH